MRLVETIDATPDPAARTQALRTVGEAAAASGGNVLKGSAFYQLRPSALRPRGQVVASIAPQTHTTMVRDLISSPVEAYSAAY